MPATGPSRPQRRPNCWPGCAWTCRDIDLVVVDLRLPHAGGVDLVRVDPQTRRRPTADPGLQWHDWRRIGGPRPGDARRSPGTSTSTAPTPHILPSLAPHLFPDNFNRRDSPRVVLGIPVAYRFGNTIAAAVTLNLGQGGIAIRTMSPLESSTRARMRFRLPNSRRDVDADARVAWSDRRVGMGMQFERIDAADQSAVEAFVDAQYLQHAN